MRRATKVKPEPEMLEEYDFSKGARGKYAKRYAAGTNVVLLEPDVAKVFPDSASVNDALRAVVRLLDLQMRNKPQRTRKKAS